jgi:amino acid permease
MVTGF